MVFHSRATTLPCRCHIKLLKKTQAWPSLAPVLDQSPQSLPSAIQAPHNAVSAHDDHAIALGNHERDQVANRQDSLRMARDRQEWSELSRDIDRMSRHMQLDAQPYQADVLRRQVPTLLSCCGCETLHFDTADSTLSCLTWKSHS